MPEKARARGPRKIWADPNREGQSKGRDSERTCSKCGNSVRKVRIFKSLNLCEYCLNEVREKRDGITSCRGCGRIEPLELKEHNGYCSGCICSACGKPDPGYVHKTGLCFQCAASLGDFCRSCGKEAAAQVRKNKGFCDECVAKGKHKFSGRRRREFEAGKKRLGGFNNKIASSAPKSGPLSLEKSSKNSGAGADKMSRSSNHSTYHKSANVGVRGFKAKTRNK